MAEVESRQGDRWAFRGWEYRTHSWCLLSKETGTRFALVPYRGGGPAVQDLVAGQIDLVMNAASDALPQVLAGNVKCLAVTAKRRLSALPEVPTVDEAGLPGFYFSQWFGLWAPKGTPNDVIGKINVAVVKALADPSMPAPLGEVGQEIFPPNQQTPESLRALHSSEIEKWGPIIRRQASRESEPTTIDDGQQRRSVPARQTSPLPPIADMARTSRHVAKSQKTNPLPRERAAREVEGWARAEESLRR